MLTGFFPHECHTGYNVASAQSIRRLLIGQTDDEPIEAMVKCRHQLRSILGEETNIEEDVDRSIFCWYLVEKFDPKLIPSASVTSTPHAGGELPELVLWPVTKQRKGLTAVKGYLETWRAVVMAATNGGTPEDIVETMSKLGLAEMTPKSRRYVFNDVRVFGFLHYENGLWFPSDDGNCLIEEDPADVLVERFLVRAYGLAQLLRLLSEAGACSRSTIYAELRIKYPNWKADYAQNAIIVWGRSLSLVEETDEGICLTEYGASWERRLPEHLPDPERNAVDDSGASPDLSGDIRITQAQGVFRQPSFDAIKPDLESSGLVLDDALVRGIHVAWHCNPRKRFVLLSGLSGTGKTAILKAYADAYCRQAQVDPNTHVALIPVAPDWRDPTGLLGYHNTLQSDPTWHRERALSLLLDANVSPEKPYFLLLDEANLAHVEQYFAPFLSSMETGLPLALHDEDEPVNEVPSRIAWPSNLFIGGTLNMDETTHKISDKVLDRAFTLEFWDVDLKRYFDKHKASASITEPLMALHDALVGIRRHFGYRTAGEIAAFCSHPDAGQDALDQAVYSKVLPRLRGEGSDSTKEALHRVLDVCKNYGLARCEVKIREMIERVETHGLTHFWS